jgi:hypothetical protein
MTQEKRHAMIVSNPMSMSGMACQPGADVRFLASGL